MKKQFLLTSILVLALAACSDVKPLSTPSSPSASNQSPQTSPFESQTNESGAVTVKVTPNVLQAGAPAEFLIAMDTHSVDLVDDMLRVVVLRDDSGKEYAPAGWDGVASGGHHRAGNIRFAALPANVQSVTLIVKGIANIPERVYQWQLK